MVNLDDLFTEAMAGRDVWISIKTLHNINENDSVLFFISLDDDLNQKAIELIEEYRIRRKRKRIFCLSTRDSILSKIENIGDENIVSYLLEEREMKALLRYYRLISFFGDIRIVSTNGIYGTDALMKTKKIKYGDFVAATIYGMV